MITGGVEAEIVDGQVMFEYLSIIFFSFVRLKAFPFPFLDLKHSLCSYFRLLSFILYFNSGLEF